MTAAQPAHLVETPDVNGAYPRLGDLQIEQLSRYGRRRRTSAGERLYTEGEHSDQFFVVLGGKVVMTTGAGEDKRIVAVHGRGRFLGELGLLEGQACFLTATVREPGEVLAVPIRRLRELVSRDQFLGDLILRAYLIRRSMLIGQGAGFRIIGSCYSPDTRRLLQFAARNRLPHRWIDLEKDPQAERMLRQLGVPPEATPVVIWHGQRVLRNPSNAELAKVIGLPAPEPGTQVADLLVIGSGPAGLAAAVYGASEGLSTVLLDAVAVGGQAATSSKIENYLGFPTGISGGELAERAAIQADKFGARKEVPAEATALERNEDHYVVRLADGGSIAARSVVLSTGVRYRRLNVPGLERFEGTGVYYAATQIEADMCHPDPVAVVGGGNSAGQATLFLADQVSKVYLLIRESDINANMSRYLVDQIIRHPRVEVLLNTELVEVEGDEKIEGIVVVNNKTGERRELDDVRDVFVFIGAVPSTDWLRGTVELDENGYVLTGQDALPRPNEGNSRVPSHRPAILETSWPGVFAAGDVRSGSIKRVASAVGEGSMSVRLVHQFFQQVPGQVRKPEPVTVGGR
jgi:thioredoxin reductase (NADPH)